MLLSLSELNQYDPQGNLTLVGGFDGTEFSFLSNFYERDFVWKEGVWHTAEHAYQACKTTTIKDFKWIIESPSPGISKRRGQKIKLRDDWEQVKVDIMESILMAKFDDQFLKEKLIATSNAELIEGNTWHDNFWGDCICDRCSKIVGKNQLGFLLMKIRKEFIAHMIIGNDKPCFRLSE